MASSFAVITGHGEAGASPDADWARLATAVDTLIVLIRWGTTDAQTTVVGTLAHIVARASTLRLAPPVVAVIGEVVALRERLRWFDGLPELVSASMS